MRVLVSGAAGQVGSAVVAELRQRSDAMRHGGGIDVIAPGHGELDVTDRDAVLGVITTVQPDVVVHCGAFTAVDACESEPDRAYAVNALGTRHVQHAARLVGAHLTYLSTDYVFDGTASRPYLEWDTPNPLSVYGRSKLGGERELDGSSAVVRTSWVQGRTGANMVKTLLRLLAEGRRPLAFVDDQRGSPTVAEDLAVTVADLALSRTPGVFHVTNQGETTWFDFARAVIGFAGGDPAIIEPIATSDLTPPRPAPRPANSVLDNAALRLGGRDLLPHWEASTEALVAELSR